MINLQHFKASALTVLNRLLTVLTQQPERRDGELSRVEVYVHLLALSPLDHYRRSTHKGQRHCEQVTGRWMVVSSQYAAAKRLVDHDERYNFSQCP